MSSGFEYARVTTEDASAPTLKVSQVVEDEPVNQHRPVSYHRDAVLHMVPSEGVPSIDEPDSFGREQVDKYTTDEAPSRSDLHIVEVAADNHKILDGLASEKGLVIVLCRVSIAALVYAISSSILVAALVTATNITMWGLSPVGVAVLHSLSVMFFVTIMMPFSILLAWIYRYRKPSAYQRRTAVIDLPYSDTFQLAVAAGMAVTNSPVGGLDYHSGRITWEVARSSGFSRPQELVVEIEKVANDQTILTINITPILNPIEYALFGYTLTVGGARSASMMESFLTFLELNMV